MPTLVADANAGENGVCDALAARGVAFTSESLPVGDFKISGNGRVLLFERKTLADWQGSMITKNGSSRLYSQRKRMCELMEEDGSVSLPASLWARDAMGPARQCRRAHPRAASSRPPPHASW